MVNVYSDVGFSKQPLVKFVEGFNDRKTFLFDLRVSLFCWGKAFGAVRDRL